MVLIFQTIFSQITNETLWKGSVFGIVFDIVYSPRQDIPYGVIITICVI